MKVKRAALILLWAVVSASAAHAQDPLCDGEMQNLDCPLTEVLVADFPDALCHIPGPVAWACPSAGEPYFGQDANYAIDPEQPTLTPDPPVWKEAVTGLWWTTGAAEANALADAEAICLNHAQAGTGGRNEWRVPDLRELSRIISPNYPTKPGTWPDGFSFLPGTLWWTSTPAKTIAHSSMVIAGNWPSGRTEPTNGIGGDFDGDRAVYCVSGPAMNGEWQVHPSENVVIHTTTRLWWERSPGIVANWSDALDYCENSDTDSFDDWRLPSIREAISMFDLDIANPTWLAPVFVAGAGNATFFTSTPYDHSDAEVLLGHYGEDKGTWPFFYDTTSTLANREGTSARCVRGPVAAPEPSAALLGATVLGLVAALRRRPWETSKQSS